MYRKRTFSERIWEILPGLQFWTVFFGAILLSYFRPVWAGLFIICFDLYWVLKALNVATHLLSSYAKFRFLVTIDWLDYVKRLNDTTAFIKFLKTEQTKYQDFKNYSQVVSTQKSL
jgi:hypothetical protein